jgi:hypothetical protein
MDTGSFFSAGLPALASFWLSASRRFCAAAGWTK